MKLFVLVASILLVLLNIFDVYSTTIVLQNGGEEANPVMAWLMAHLGVLPALLSMKVTFLSLLIWAAVKALKKVCLLVTFHI